MNDRSRHESTTCKAICQAIEESMDGAPGSRSQQAIESHLAACAACREHRADLLTLRTQLRGLPLVALPDEALAVVLSRTVEAKPRKPILMWLRGGRGSVAAAAALVLAVGLSGVLVGRDRGPSPAQVDRATAQTYYVLELTSGALRQVEHVTVSEVLEGHVTTAFKRITTKWSSLSPPTTRRSGT